MRCSRMNVSQGRRWRRGDLQEEDIKVSEGRGIKLGIFCEIPGKALGLAFLMGVYYVAR